MAFPSQAPSKEAVKAHVAKCRASIPGAFEQSVPVLWDFGPYGRVLHWERRENLRPYADDYLDWLSARERESRRLAPLDRLDSNYDLAVFRASRSDSPIGEMMRQHL